MRGCIHSGVFAHTLEHAEILQGYMIPFEEPGCSLGWGEQARKQVLSDQEKGKNLERPKEVIERATKTLNLPCWSLHQ